jgi:hypothetical protein
MLMLALAGRPLLASVVELPAHEAARLGRAVGTLRFAVELAVQTPTW